MYSTLWKNLPTKVKAIIKINMFLNKHKHVGNLNKKLKVNNFKIFKI